MNTIEDNNNNRNSGSIPVPTGFEQWLVQPTNKGMVGNDNTNNIWFYGNDINFETNNNNAVVSASKVAIKNEKYPVAANAAAVSNPNNGGSEPLLMPFNAVRSYSSGPSMLSCSSSSSPFESPLPIADSYQEHVNNGDEDDFNSIFDPNSCSETGSTTSVESQPKSSKKGGHQQQKQQKNVHIKTETPSAVVTGAACTAVGVEDDLISPMFTNNDIELLRKKTMENKSKKRKRGPRKLMTPDQKEAHNKIEKKYRININTKIARLQKIIPWVASEDTAFEVHASFRGKDLLGNVKNNNGSDSISDNNTEGNGNDDATNTGNNSSSLQPCKLNKSIILQKAIDYILYLKNNERLYELEVQKLKDEIKNLQNNKENTNVKIK
ncbi:uncharacterized protein SCODWIG_01739 [Saccharomycodes ludwigii]|uniref:BHLH domain-containing protein n=1 Tax=Saccharomycodes ludwigii TaxID=36035 RepID=A0A376B5L3_9ASCO|nr:hypothetical protein SCDLUD_000449 [Saccharomycodes ludwigii]KAH3902856.1 hypothetical protein SCDLUD_000449 [Saccharomycodes ludwigii]SSD59978.1 uncharacterized protein SCODWIG_01739 [Saccharomycodes ludwigii]